MKFERWCSVHLFSSHLTIFLFSVRNLEPCCWKKKLLAPLQLFLAYFIHTPIKSLSLCRAFCPKIREPASSTGLSAVNNDYIQAYLSFHTVSSHRTKGQRLPLAPLTSLGLKSLHSWMSTQNNRATQYVQLDCYTKRHHAAYKLSL